MAGLIEQYRTEFPQADENPLSDGGVWRAGIDGSLQVVNHKIRVATVGVAGNSSISSVLWTPDQWGQFRLGTWNAGSAATNMGLQMRLRQIASGSDTWYELDLPFNVDAAHAVFHVWRGVAGVFTKLAGSDDGTGGTPLLQVAPVAGDSLLGSIDGYRLQMRWNGALVVDVIDTDATKIASGNVGLAAFVIGGAAGDVEIDQFIAGGFATPFPNNLRPRAFAPGRAR